MNAVTPDGLDLAQIAGHVAARHPEQENLPVLAANLSRLHARWHSRKAADHGHAGAMTTMSWGTIYASHPSGWFTGKDVVALPGKQE